MMQFQGSQNSNIKKWFKFSELPTLHWVKNNFTYFFSKQALVWNKSLSKGGGRPPIRPPPVAPVTVGFKISLSRTWSRLADSHLALLPFSAAIIVLFRSHPLSGCAASS